MGAVGFGALLFAVLLLVVALFIWQGLTRSTATDYAEYVIPEAADFVFERLSPRALRNLDRESVARILEWNLHYGQVVAPGTEKRPAVVGRGDGLEYVLQRASTADTWIDPIDVAEVLTIETEYLLEIGAVGPTAEEPG